MKCPICKDNLYQLSSHDPTQLHCNCGFDLRKNKKLTECYQYTVYLDKYILCSFRGSNDGKNGIFTNLSKIESGSGRKTYYIDLIRINKFCEPDNYEDLESYKKIIDKLLRLVVFS